MMPAALLPSPCFFEPCPSLAAAAGRRAVALESLRYEEINVLLYLSRVTELRCRHILVRPIEASGKFEGTLRILIISGPALSVIQHNAQSSARMTFRDE